MTCANTNLSVNRMRDLSTRVRFARLEAGFVLAELLVEAQALAVDHPALAAFETRQIAAETLLREDLLRDLQQIQPQSASSELLGDAYSLFGLTFVRSVGNLVHDLAERDPAYSPDRLWTSMQRLLAKALGELP